MTSDPRTMDTRLQGLPKLHHRVNGGSGQSSRPREDDPVHFLSQEEQDCLNFFEKTIDSLDESLETSDMNPSLSAARPEPKDQDIIYLVRPEPDLVQNKAPAFNPNRPDFQNMMQNPESHVEMRPRREVSDGLPSEYNPPLPSGSYGPTDHHSSYHPPGSIPTPVLIAQQIADNKGGGASNLHPSSFLRSHNQDHDKPQNPVGHPPTSAKASRFPTNISVTPHGNKESQNQSLGNVNLQERRSQMLTNLSGTPNTLLQEDPRPVSEPAARNDPAHSLSFKDPSPDQSRMEALSRNRAMSGPLKTLLQEDPQTAPEQAAWNDPARNISFMDPSPDQSRMEALSKLGLNRNRAMSGGKTPSLDVPDGTPQSPPAAKATSGKLPEAVDLKVPKEKVVAPQPSPVPTERKPEIQRSDSLRRFDERNQLLSALSVTQSSAYLPPPLDDMASFPPPPEVAPHKLNSYGGKSISVKPSAFTRREPAAPPSHEPKVLPSGLSNPSEFNPYGGKTKVMNLGTRSNLPDLLAPHVDRSQTLPARSEPPPPTELNSYGGKSRTFNPAAGPNRPPDGPARSFRAAPTPAPKPGRHSYHGGGAVAPQRPVPRALSPEHRRKTASTFRPQGITVQFSGRGATDESRREALRKLGLLKDS